MHAHSSDKSLDSGVSARSLAEQARWRGLDGVVLTEHNALWRPADLVALSEQVEMTVLAGMELGTDAGHVLVYGLDRYRPELLILERLRRIVESEGAAMVLAHPMRPFHGPRPAADSYASWFHGIETINGDHSDSEHGYLVREAEMLQLASVGGSDAHSRQAVGRVATAFTRPVRSVADIVEQLHSRDCFAVDFRGKITG
ncbi:MAG TPA: PHP-associated domain-containing protein [Tepidiformaceae bacterium]|nr:PHP-associated domain-containing protein [Tepidiformaceae bacterium]